jgi:hypothetical protein
MTGNKVNPLHGEQLIPIKAAAEDFGGVAIPLRTVRHYVYNGFQGIKLETININGRYTSREAIQRFIERKQNPGQPVEKPKRKRLTQAEVDAGLRRHGLVK